MTLTVYVVFGAAVRADGSPSRTLQRRTEGAWVFAQEQNQPALFIVSGALGRYPPSEAEVMEGLLIDKGVAPDSIIKDDASTDTLESIINCSKLVRALPGYTHLYVCTSPYHSWRCQFLFRLVGLPFKRANISGDLTHLGLSTWLRYCVKECLAIPWDSLLLLIKGV